MEYKFVRPAMHIVQEDPCWVTDVAIVGGSRRTSARSRNRARIVTFVFTVLSTAMAVFALNVPSLSTYDRIFTMANDSNWERSR